jgi:hypothetical protein
MPTVTIDRAVTIEDTAAALQQKLDDGYEITTYGQGAEEALKVKRSAAAATVLLYLDGSTTTFHVHGGGSVISRMINEFGIA